MPPILKPARRRDGDVTAPELPRTLTTPGSQHSDVAGSVDSEILLKEVLRQHVTLAAHNPSGNHG